MRWSLHLTSRRTAVVICSALVAVNAWSISAPAQAADAGSQTQFAIHGSNTIGARLMPAIIEAFAHAQGGTAATVAGGQAEEVEIKLTNSAGEPLASIGVQSHGSGTAVPGLISGKAVIGMASRPLEDKEAKALQQAGFPELRVPGKENVLALDGLLVLVAPQNPVQSLTMDQISGMFSGATTDWSAVGGTPGPIHVYARNDKSGTYDTFNSLVLKPKKLALRSDAQRLESSEELSDLVARDPNGIGYVGFAYLRNAKAVSIGNECGLLSAPTPFNVKTEEYPLARRLFLYANDLSRAPVAASLLKFALSPEARDAIVAAGFIDQEFDRLDSQGQLMRMAQGIPALDTAIDLPTMKDLALTLQTSSRVSSTLHFRMNSTSLDSKATADVDRLAGYIKQLAKSDPAKTVIVAGFSDSAGDFAHNMVLSQGRAEQVKQALLRSGGSDIPPAMVVARGFSKLLPASCNTTEQGRNNNRRVEIWVK